MSATLVNLMTKTGTYTCSWTVLPTSLSFSAAGQTLPSVLTTDCDWTAVNRNSDAWLTFTPSSGSSTTTINVTAAVNSGASRIGYVDIDDALSNVVATIQCNQAGSTPSCGGNIGPLTLSGGPFIKMNIGPSGACRTNSLLSVDPWDGVMTYVGINCGYRSSTSPIQSWLGRMCGPVSIVLWTGIQITGEPVPPYWRLTTPNQTGGGGETLYFKTYGSNHTGTYTAASLCQDPQTLTLS